MQIKTKVVLATVLAVGLVVALGSSVNLHGNIINADTGFQYQQAAPAGHTLVGNGSEYVDSGTEQDEWVTFTGCSFANDGANLTCTVAVTLPTAMVDTNYSVNCTEYANPSVGSPIYQNYDVESPTTTGFTWFEITSGSSAAWGTYPNYGKSFTCHAHHN